MKLKHHIRNIGRIFLGSVGISLLGGMVAGCSDNKEPGLYAASESNIQLSIAASGYENGLLAVGSAQSATPFTVTSTTRWVVEVTDCEGAWCQIVYGDTQADEAGHIGDGYFYIETAANRTQEIRKCLATVYAIEKDGTKVPGKSIEINVEQDRQSIDVDYAGYVISAFGTNSSTEPLVRVTANQAWTYSCSHSWVSVVPGSNMTADGFTPVSGSSVEVESSFRIKVEPNPGTSIRFAEVVLSSPTWSFTPIRLNVTQEGSTETFFITPTNVPVIPFTGDVIEFQVYSPRDNWKVQAVSSGNWVSLDRTSGEPSMEPVVIRATVARNEDSQPREAGVVFTRDNDMGETTITLTQQGNPDVPDPVLDPVVSTAWIVTGWTSTAAELRAYYLSPSFPVTGCGAYVTPFNGSGETQRYYGDIVSYEEMMVNLTNLQPNTEYMAVPYVTYTVNGTTLEATGGSTVFITPDRNGNPGNEHETPNPDDNNPPSVN